MTNTKNNTAKAESKIIIKDENGKKVEVDTTTTATVNKVSDDVLVKVKSNVYGELIYVNQKSGEKTTWETAGDVQVMSVGDLRAMKADQAAFFKNQWIVIIGLADGEASTATCSDIYKSLIITKYYLDYIEPSDFVKTLAWKESELKERINMMTPAAKENLIIALNSFIENGSLDSIKKIKAFENALGCQLGE